LEGASLLQEFKDFINRGNLVEIAVGLILALAFVPVVNSIVNDIILPFIAAIFGEPNFDSLDFTVGDGVIAYGRTITAIVTFLLIALVLFFIVKAYNRIRPPEETDDGPTEVELLTEIRDELRAR
jgi:large conductance mechanosensitive channel